MYTFLEREFYKEHIGNVKILTKVTIFEKITKTFFLPLFVQDKLKIDKNSKNMNWFLDLKHPFGCKNEKTQHLMRFLSPKSNSKLIFKIFVNF